MAWWAIGKSEKVGDGPVNLAKAAFERLAGLRTETQRPALRLEDVVTLLTAAFARSSRELQPRKEAKFVGLTLTLEDGSTLQAQAEEVKPVADELAILRDWAKKAAAEYKEMAEQLGRRRPTANELLEAASVVLRDGLPEETRKLKGIVARYEHAQGQVTAEEVVSIVAASLRRNERRLGLLVEAGATMSPEDVVGTTLDGREIRISCEDGQASRELVDEMCDRFDAIIREHRQESPEKFLATLSQGDRERFQRNADARGLPTLDGLIEEIRGRLAETPERWEPLASLQVETSSRSGIGLPSKPAPTKFVDSRLRVRHGKFGDGYVERIFEDGEKKYEVLFDGGKRVTLLARFLESVD